MTDKLKPCPFCGGKASKMLNGDEDNYFWWIECSNCNATIDSFATSDAAIEAWNTRAVESERSRTEYDGAIDSREKLEADVLKKHNYMGPKPYSLVTTYDDVIGWLDRQAAITRREAFEDGEYDCMTCDTKNELREKVDMLRTERDLMQAEVDHHRRVSRMHAEAFAKLERECARARMEG